MIKQEMEGRDNTRGKGEEVGRGKRWKGGTEEERESGGKCRRRSEGVTEVRRGSGGDRRLSVQCDGTRYRITENSWAEKTGASEDQPSIER